MLPLLILGTIGSLGSVVISGYTLAKNQPPSRRGFFALGWVFVSISALCLNLYQMAVRL